MIDLRGSDWARLWLALISALILVSLMSHMPRPLAQTMGPVGPIVTASPVPDQAVINMHQADQITAIYDRVAKIESLHLEKLQGAFDESMKVEYGIAGVLLANLIGTIIQIRSQRDQRTRKRP